jgi:MFS family permease
MHASSSRRQLASEFIVGVRVRLLADRGVMSGAQKFVQADLGVTDAQLEVLIGATSVYSLVGSLAAGWACDRAGRRRTIALSAALFLAGSAVTAAADGYAALMAGQFVAGVACGFGLVVAPVYIAEISPANARGFLSSIPEVRTTYYTTYGADSPRAAVCMHGCSYVVVNKL